MALKLSSRQQARLAVLQAFPLKFDAIHRMIEEMASPRVDVSVARRLSRTLDEMKIAAQSVGETGMAGSLGLMATLARRTGSVQTRSRGLREGFGSVKINLDGAIRAASTPEPVDPDADERPAEPATPSL